MMQKYIRTYYDNSKLIIKLSGCNQCPLLSYNKITNKCYCRYYCNNGSSLLLENMDIVYSDSFNKIYTQINIPKWCKLCDTLGDLYNNRHTFKILKTGIRVNTLDNDGINLKILNSDKPYADIIINMNKYIHEDLPITSTNNNLPATTNTIKPHLFVNNLLNNTLTKESKKSYCECSMCKEEDETVSRDKNFGMCEDCWELFEDDDIRKRQAYINNFRLKRNIKNNNFNFKTVIELNID